MPTLCERPDISIIVPVYNLEKHLDPLIFSLMMQELGDYKTEIIFVLNNCTDNSEQVIRDWGLDCTILTCEEQGCGCARNVGFEHSSGEYIWFMDGDDWLVSKTAIRDVLDRARGLDIIYIPFDSKTFTWQYFSMVAQYLLRREFVEEFRFRQAMPGEDDAYMGQVLAKAGHSRFDYWTLPAMDKPQWYYNYGREGSNMWRVARGEDINIPPVR